MAKTPPSSSTVRRSPAAGGAQRDKAADVPAFISGLAHPHEAVILALRKIVLGVDRDIVEGIKWNAPSFRTTEDFATFHLRAKDGVQLVLHRGAKRRPDADTFSITDPSGLLDWRGRDRALVHFSDLKDVAAKKTALVRVLREWVKQV